MFKYCKIKSIKKVQKTTIVYNFSVPKYETYIANGFAVHNCQNYKVSQTIGKSVYKSPEQLAALASEKNAKGIAFSFNEPTVHWEYITSVAELYPNTVIKTNGFASKHVFDVLSKNVRAFNVDIKGNDQDYKSICDGSLQPVLDSIKQLSDKNCHIEISYLVVPDRVTDFDFHNFVRDYLASINTHIPVHILYFYPFLRMQNDYYPPESVLKVVESFRKEMSYVYVSNVHNEDTIHFRDTKCRKCDSVLINRQGQVQITKLHCCGEKIAGIFCPALQLNILAKEV